MCQQRDENNNETGELDAKRMKMSDHHHHDANKLHPNSNHHHHHMSTDSSGPYSDSQSPSLVDTNQQQQQQTKYLSHPVHGTLPMYGGGGAVYPVGMAAGYPVAQSEFVYYNLCYIFLPKARKTMIECFSDLGQLYNKKRFIWIFCDLFSSQS